MSHSSFVQSPQEMPIKAIENHVTMTLILQQKLAS